MLIPGAAAPKLISAATVKAMKPGSVIVDVAIDQGGCSETSRPTTHSNPTYLVDEVVHYCVTNMPGAVARTSTFALNNGTLPFVLKEKPFSDDSPSKPYDEPSESDRYEMIRTYFSMLIEEELPDATGKMKQFASWFTHGVPGGAGLRKAIYDSKTAPEILTRVEEFFEARLANGSATVQSAAQLVP